MACSRPSSDRGWVGGTISSIFLNIWDRFDAQVFLGVVLYNKKNISLPCYMAKNENNPRQSFDSLNKAF